MAWTIEISDDAKKILAKLDKQIGKRLIKFLRERIATAEDPRSLGAALKGEEFGGLWRYRVGDYRIICSIKDKQLVILVVTMNHRSQVYR